MMMETLEPGDVILTRSHCLVGSLIRFGERVRYAGWRKALGWLARTVLHVAPPDTPDDPWYVNHAVVYIGDGDIIEALARGLTLSPVTKYSLTPHVELHVANLIPTVTDKERARACAFARDQLDRHDRYGWLSIMTIVVQLLTPAKLDVSWDGALICSAFAAQALEHVGVTLPTRSSLTTMPADLAEMAKIAPLPPPAGTATKAHPPKHHRKAA